MKQNEQKLIDIVFSIAQTSYLMNRDYEEVKSYYSKERDEHMECVAKQLKDCGFPTIPIGMSWGVLKNDV